LYFTSFQRPYLERLIPPETRRILTLILQVAGQCSFIYTFPYTASQDLHFSPMDPISIGTAATGLIHICANLTGRLFTFLSRARTVDESIQTLRFEIESLSQSLISLRSSFDDPLIAEAIVNTQARHERQHWQNVRQSLVHCSRILTRFEEMLENVESCEGHFLINVRRQIRMDMRSREMVLFKEQITSCRRTLHLSLQLITVYSSQDYHVLTG